MLHKPAYLSAAAAAPSWISQPHSFSQPFPSPSIEKGRSANRMSNTPEHNKHSLGMGSNVINQSNAASLQCLFPIKGYRVYVRAKRLSTSDSRLSNQTNPRVIITFL